MEYCASACPCYCLNPFAFVPMGIGNWFLIGIDGYPALLYGVLREKYGLRSTEYAVMEC